MGLPPVIGADVEEVEGEVVAHEGGAMLPQEAEEEEATALCKNLFPPLSASP